MREDAEGAAREPRVLILGIGNRILGDDGVGSCFAEALSSLKLPGWIRAIDGGLGGIELLEEIENSDILFLVDSVAAEDDPGDRVKVYKVNELPMNPEEALMMLTEVGRHGVSPEILLSVALAIGKLPKEAYVIGIVPNSIELNDRISEEAKKGCIEALKLIEAILGKMGLGVVFDIAGFLEKLREIC
ncbi:MAG: hydrogenase maturation protease [Candidatus Korarchaeum sp.]